MIVKARTQGNSVMITIPSEFNIPAGTEYEVKLSPAGEIIYTPKANSGEVYATDSQAMQYVDQIFEEYDQVFKELVDR